jgi:hypothetical protein
MNIERLTPEDWEPVRHLPQRNRHRERTFQQTAPGCAALMERRSAVAGV